MTTARLRLVAWVGQSDEAIAADIERVWRDEVPARIKHGSNQHSKAGGRGTNSSKSDTADSILARLKRDNPDLAQRIINGEITANAAARIMGAPTGSGGRVHYRTLRS